MTVCNSCGNEHPEGASFCPSCGAGAPAGHLSPSEITGAEKGLMVTGAVGAFVMVAVVLLQFLPYIIRIQRSARGELMIVNAIIGLMALICVGIGFLGFQRATWRALAITTAIFVFLGAAMALMPMIAVTARSRDIIQFSMVAAPVIGMVVWTLAGISMLGARSRIGSGLAITIFVLLLVSRVYQFNDLST